MKIIYPTQDGIAIIFPTGLLPVSEVARKDVPEGVPYLIVQDGELPEDLSEADALEFDFSNPDGLGIGQEAWAAEAAIEVDSPAT